MIFNNIRRGCLLGVPLFFTLSVCEQSPVYAADADVSDSIAHLKGADMAVYSLYEDYRDSDYDRAMEYVRIFLEGLDTSAYNQEVAEMCDMLSAWYEKEQYNFSEAINWKMPALGYYETAGQESRVASARHALAKLYYRKGEYHRTLEYLTEALPVFYKCRDMVAVMECHNLLGGVYFACGDYDRAYDYFQLYVRESKNAGDSLRYCVALNNMAAWYSIKKDTVRTGRLIEEAIDISMKMNDTMMMSRSWLNLSSFYINDGRYSEAEKCLSSARELLKDVSHYGQYWLNWSLLLKKTGNVVEANDSLAKAVKCYSAGEFDKDLLKCYNLMIDNFRLLGDTVNMYRASWQYHEVAERISDRETSLQLFQYQNEIIRQKESEKETETRALRKVYVSVSVCILAIMGMGIWLYARNRTYQMRRKEEELERQKLINEQNEQVIRSKNEILEIKKLDQFRMERMIEEMTGKFQSLCEDTKDKDVCARIMQICAEVRHSMEMEMEDVHNFIPEFNSDLFRKLLKDFPDLTVNERRLCALLHMNLSTKDISEITRQTPHSINIARGRLRNKLGLKGSKQTIQEFLSTYLS